MPQLLNSVNTKVPLSSEGRHGNWTAGLSWDQIQVVPWHGSMAALLIFFRAMAHGIAQRREPMTWLC